MVKSVYVKLETHEHGVKLAIKSGCASKITQIENLFPDGTHIKLSVEEVGKALMLTLLERIPEPGCKFRLFQYFKRV